MSALNSYNGIGRLTREPELRTTSNGKSVLGFCIALDVGWGEQKKTLFLECVAFGKTAEALASHCAKGARLGISGRLEPDEYTSRDGTQVKRIKCVVDNAAIIDWADQEEARPAQRPSDAAEDEYDPFEED